MPVTEPPIAGTVTVKTTGTDKGLYRAKVADVDESYLFIDVPIHVGSGKELSVRVGDTLVIEYVGVGSEVYRYSSTILGVSYIPTPALRLLSPTLVNSIERVQRREFYRISLDTEVHVTRANGDTYELSAVDISGGGIAIKCTKNQTFEYKELVRLNVVLPYIESHLDVECRVMRAEEVEPSIWVVSMMFENISERERQQVVRYTFMRQRFLKR